MSVTLPSGKYVVPVSRAPEPGSDVDPDYLLRVQDDCAKSDVQHFLSYSERSTGQLRKKVISLGFSTEVAEATVCWAIEYGLVDDLRFCALFVSSRTMGRSRLKMELLKRDVPEAAINEVLSTVSEKESVEELIKQVKKRYGHIEDLETARRRGSGWLSRRGFSGEIVHRVLKESL